MDQAGVVQKGWFLLGQQWNKIDHWGKADKTSRASNSEKGEEGSFSDVHKYCNGKGTLTWRITQYTNVCMQIQDKMGDLECLLLNEEIW